MEELFDMHCHLDFAEDAESVAKASGGLSICALTCTVVPSSFVSSSERFAGLENIHVALGLHPWWVADNRISEVDIARFESQLPETRLIGEVGLDLAGTRKATKELQCHVLRRILSDIHEAHDGRVITFHAVHATTQLLDMLDDLHTLDANTALFHWFQGSHEEFGRAVATGAFFSVGMKMMATAPGQRYAAAIPSGQLLLETDSPAHEGCAWDEGAWRQELDNTVRSLAKLRGLCPDALARTCAANARRVLAQACA